RASRGLHHPRRAARGERVGAAVLGAHGVPHDGDDLSRGSRLVYSSPAALDPGSASGGPPLPARGSARFGLDGGAVGGAGALPGGAGGGGGRAAGLPGAAGGGSRRGAGGQGEAGA
ncbi:hypothetical protein H632_c5341p0, partial [Helicosporidium sp. ATCC 50920]